MDRKIIYPAQIPLVEDQLQAARFTQIGIGRISGALYGEGGTGASGFACTPVSGMIVSVAPGQIVSPGVVDTTSYGVLAADSSPLPIQYILPDATQVTVPSTAGTYIIYATPSVTDTTPAVLPFYNSATPTQVYAGPDNDGSSTDTIRSSQITLGIAATVPSGSVPLWSVTVASGVTAITADMISVASAAPFYPSLAATAPRTVAPFNAALAAAMGGYPLNAIVADPSTAGLFWVSTAANNTTTPGATGASWQSLFDGYATEAWVGEQGYATETWVEDQGYATETWVEGQDYATESYVESGIVAGLGLAKYNSSPGYSTLPGGMIIQYGQSASGSEGDGTVSFPIAFPTACISVTLTESGAGGTWPGSGSGGQPTVHGMTGAPSTTSFSTYSMQYLSNAWTGKTGLTFSWIAIGY